MLALSISGSTPSTIQIRTFVRLPAGQFPPRQSEHPQSGHKHYRGQCTALNASVGSLRCWFIRTAEIVLFNPTVGRRLSVLRNWSDTPPGRRRHGGGDHDGAEGMAYRAADASG